MMASFIMVKPEGIRQIQGWSSKYGHDKS